MNTSSNLLVLGVAGQVGKLVAKNLRRSGANFSVGTRTKANLKELADQFGASRFIDLDDPGRRVRRIFIRARDGSLALLTPNFESMLSVLL